MISREQYDQFRVSPFDPTTLRVDGVETALSQLAANSAGRLHVEEYAESCAGRPIYLATLGRGPRRVLMWSQMHGDEPTHTAVVLDLLSYLLRSPAEPQSETILSGCTLSILPLLNPDGAERMSRFNAQDIDVNRDAQRLATPEGRALRRAVETIRPDFAFNLHNQNARTAAGMPPKAVVASLLAPPPDRQRTVTEAVQRAAQVATCFIQAVRPDVDHVDGMVSRYDDTYEPRAFGDWIQSTGAATVLVEAGGWPEADPEPLVRLHFHGLLAALQAIATDSYRMADRAVYDSLPESNSGNLTDCLLAGGRVADSECDAPYPADLAINHTAGNRLEVSRRRDGTIVDVGDLSVLGGKQTISAAGCVVVPGRVAVLEDWSLVLPLAPERLETLLAAGVTTVVGVIQPTNAELIRCAAAVTDMPVNWAFVARLDSSLPLHSEVVGRLASAVLCGALAIVCDRIMPQTRQALETLQVPLVEIDAFRSRPEEVDSYQEHTRQIGQTHAALGLNTHRGKIGRGFFADIQLVETDVATNALPGNVPPRLKRLLVAGETVWENGIRTGKNPGVFLRGR